MKTHNYEDIKFKNWKKAKGLNEDFLDGSEEETVSPDDSTGEDQNKEPTDGSIEEPDNDIDISEEPTGEEGSEETTNDDASLSGDESEGSEEEKDNLDDFGAESSEEKEDDGTPDEAEGTTELKDILATLTTAIQTLTDKVDNLNKEPEGGEEGGDLGGDIGGEEPAEDFGGEEGGEDSMDDFGSEEGGEESGSEEGGEESGSEEGGEEGGESSEGSSSEESSEGEEGGSEEEEAPADETKTEAFNFYARKGQPLSDKSDYLMGKVYNSRYDLLEEDILKCINAKIRQKIEAAKKQIKMEAIKARQTKPVVK